MDLNGILLYIIIMSRVSKTERRKKINKPVQTEMDYKEIPWIDWFYLDDEEKDYYKQGPMQEKFIRLFEYVSRKKGRAKKIVRLFLERLWII